MSISPTFHEQLLLSDSKSAKNIVKPSVFFALLRSGCIKASGKLSVKLTPVVKKGDSVSPKLFRQTIYQRTKLKVKVRPT